MNSVCRSHSKHLLATGDDFGKVKLFNYPSVLPHSPYKEYAGHSSHVTNVRFSNTDRMIASIGGHDKTLIIWSTGTDEDQQTGESDSALEEVEDAYGSENEEEDKSEEENKEGGEEKRLAKHKKEEPDMFAMFEVEDAGAGDQFMAVKPWKGAIKAPSGFVRAPYDQSKPPSVELKLDYIYGYRARDCSNNLHYAGPSSTKTIVYHAAGVGILLDRDENSQSFFNKHKDDILALAFHREMQLVATGEVGAKPSIYIWNTMEA